MSEMVLDQKSASALARELGKSFSGEVLVAGGPGYHDARAIWNAMGDKKPLVIACCATTEDVVASVNLARQHRLQTSVRCGGRRLAPQRPLEWGLARGPPPPRGN